MDCEPQLKFTNDWLLRVLWFSAVKCADAKYHYGLSNGIDDIWEISCFRVWLGGRGFSQKMFELLINVLELKITHIHSLWHLLLLLLSLVGGGAWVCHWTVPRGGWHGLEVLSIWHHSILGFFSHSKQVESSIWGYIFILSGNGTASWNEKYFLIFCVKIILQQGTARR